MARAQAGASNDVPGLKGSTSKLQNQYIKSPPNSFVRFSTILSCLAPVALAAWSYSRGADSQTYCYKGIQTLDSDQPTARCFTVSNGIFTEVKTVFDNGATKKDTSASDGRLEEGHSFHSDELRKRHESGGGAAADVANGYVIPGLWDGHGHLVDYGEMLVQVDLFGASSLDEVRSRLKDYIRKHPESGTKERWLRGIGWDQTDFGRMPTAVRVSMRIPSHIFHANKRC